MVSSETKEITSGLSMTDKSARYLGGTLDRAVVVCSKSVSRILTMPLSREASCDRLHLQPVRKLIREQNETDHSGAFANTLSSGASVKLVMLPF